MNPTATFHTVIPKFKKIEPLSIFCGVVIYFSIYWGVYSHKNQKNMVDTYHIGALWDTK